jgi:hypothetical protein
MSQNIEFYKQKIIDAKNLKPELVGLTSDSKVSVWGNFSYIIAVCVGIFDQLLDLFRAEIETKTEANPPSTGTFVVDKSKNLFQYDINVPQILQVINDKSTYTTIDLNKRIITRCAITTLPNKKVVVQVAKSEPPEKLTANELIAYDQFLDNMLPIGINYTAYSSDPNKVYILADVYFNGSLASSIKEIVVKSINSYLSLIDENSFLVISDLENAIKQTEGVISVVLKKVYLRADTNSFTLADKIYDLSLGINVNKAKFSAGYAVTETTALNTINDTITYISA